MPVVKPTTIRILLFVAIANHWLIRQLDAENVFFAAFSMKKFTCNNPSLTICEFIYIRDGISFGFGGDLRPKENLGRDQLAKKKITLIFFSCHLGCAMVSSSVSLSLYIYDLKPMSVSI